MSCAVLLVVCSLAELWRFPLAHRRPAIKRHNRRRAEHFRKVRRGERYIEQMRRSQWVVLVLVLLYLVYRLDLPWYYFRSFMGRTGRYSSFCRGEVWSRPWWTVMDRVRTVLERMMTVIDRTTGQGGPGLPLQQ